MSLCSTDPEFVFALRSVVGKRTERELNVIYSRLNRMEILSSMREQSLRSICSIVRYEHHEANEILYRKDEACRCWYILLSGSVFIQGSMFLPHACFGKQIPGTKRRGCQCLVLEHSEMIAIDYPDMTIHTSSLGSRPHAMMRHDSGSSRGTLDSVAEVDTFPDEQQNSPLHHTRNDSAHKIVNGQIVSTDNISQFSKDADEGDDYSEQDLEEEDSISLHSSSSNVIKDLVIDVLKKDISDRNGDDLEILLEFTKSLQAFSNLTEPTRRALCKVMVFAWVERAGTVVLKDNELLDSWSVIINGSVQVRRDVDDVILEMGDSFGVEPTLQPQQHRGVMYTTCDDCQFLCIAQMEYFQVLHQGMENIQNIHNEAGDLVMVKEKREFEAGAKVGNIVIRGTAESLLHHLLEENTIDTTYTEDYLLTYRAFNNDPLNICNKLLEWFDNPIFRDKVIRVILLWVNNHFNDFECDWKMMGSLEKFEEKLHQANLNGQTKLFNIACTAKAQPRHVTIARKSRESELCFDIVGGAEKSFPIYISSVVGGSEAEAKGVKRGDLLLEVNGQNFEKLTLERATSILLKNTDLSLTLKTSLFAFKEMMSDLANPQKKKKSKNDEKNIFFPPGQRGGRVSLTMMNDSEVFDQKHKKGSSIGGKTKRFMSKFNVLPKMPSFDGGDSRVSMDDGYLVDTPENRRVTPGSSNTIDGLRSFKQSASISLSNPDLLDPAGFTDLAALAEIPEDVIKVYRADQTHKFLFVNRDTTAGDAVQTACNEFGITEDVGNYALYKVSVQGEKFVKQSKLPDPLSKLADIPLGSRYYLKNTMNSEQLLPDENIPELLKEANFSFLDLNCFEVAVYLTRKDYKMFKNTASTDFIQDLFHLEGELTQFKAFEDLVNRELFWVVTTLCREANFIQRTKIIKHFVKIAHHCKILKNLNSTFALISGLGYRAVSRMKLTWEKVPTKTSRVFEELQALMDPSRNMSKYRTLLNEIVSQPPVIPYIPVIKKDLTFLHLGNDTRVDNLINFEKMRMIGKEVRNVCRLCAPDGSQILPSAAAQQKEGSQNPIYLTLARRGRRSSFNNVRRLYDDQLNVRRVKQYMESIDVVVDEDQLMEMSKSVEPLSQAARQDRRRNTTASLPADSPSRSSKTLPANPLRTSSNGSSSGLHSRNNSEPHLAAVPAISLHPTRKKTPVSTLPKFGANSPQALRKLLALSEEGGEKNPSKKLGGRRNGSVGSHDLSPSTSPYMSPKRREDGQSTVANENVNRNNNRLSLPAGTTEPHSPGIQSAPLHSRKFFPPGGSSATSSSRSSIASASSVGTNHTLSSLSSHGDSSSPRSSSPVAWGLGGIPPQHQGPGRTSSSSSADTVKSAGRPHERPPVIKTSRNTRSSSFGGGAMCSDRRINPISTSNPSLNAPINNPLILPNHPQIPRTPSIDSGIVSAGSISADSTRFNPDEADLFGRYSRPHHRDHHRVNDAAPHPRRQPQQYGETPPNPRRQPPTDVENDKVEQTFLSGFRGLRDSPRPDKKDPSNYYTQGGYPSEPTLYPGHVPPGVNRPMYVVPRGFGKGVVKGIHDYLICERHAMMRYRMQHKPDPKTPEALLEDQLVLELQNQRPQNSRPRRRNSPPICEDSNLASTKRLSLSKSDPALNNYPESCYEGVIPTRTSSPKSFIKQASLGLPSPLTPMGDTVFTPHSIYHTPNTSKNSFSTPLKALDTPSYPQFTPTSTPNSSRTSIPARAEDPSLNWQYPAQEFPPQRPTTLNMPPWASPITPTSHFDPHHEMNGVTMTPNIPPQLLHGSPGPHPRRKMSQDWSETDLDGEIPQQTITAWGSSASLPSTPMISKSGNPPKHQPDHLHPTLHGSQTTPHGSQTTPHGSHINPRTSKEKKPAPAPPQRSTSFARSRQLRLSTHGSPDSPPPFPTSNLSFDASVAKLGSRLDNGWLNNGHVIGNGRIGFNQTTEQRTGLDRRSLPTYTEAVNQIHLKQSRFTTTNYRSFNIETRENSEQVSQV